MSHRRIAPRHLGLFLLLPLSLAACGDDGVRAWDGTQAGLRARVASGQETADSLYANGIAALQARRWQQAVELFDLVEREHPFSTWATNAKLMGAYGEYMRNRYPEAIGRLDNFIQLHPAHRDIAYAYYLRALCFYEQINDVQRDQSASVTAITVLQEVVDRFPDTTYARDAKLKIDLARDHLAGREMDVGRFYQKRKLYGAALGRFRNVVDNYQNTNHAAEALHRMVEIYLALGLPDEAKRTASVLGHNYPGSEWYQDSYNLLVENGQAPRDENSPGFFGRMWNSVF
ncbi:outer membrane protein assembly factor BamD [Acetobacteraceae bacterium H6797]|nr:outer membrane protein assembly factor BamD [Acetobacteraceae bacterium H6797]